MELEIKYRAYHFAEKKMCRVELIRFGKGAFLYGVAVEPEQVIDGGRYIVKSIEDGRFCQSNEFKLMQFTGRYDNTKWKELTTDEQSAYLAAGCKKNKWPGREIYANDIVSISQPGIPSLKNNYEVVWNNNAAGFYFIDAKREGDDFGVYTRRVEGIQKEHIIIEGNVFQNPELATEQKIKRTAKKATA